jgi:hypothetical protein
VGQNYWVSDGCAAKGTPGVASTYTLEMAVAALNRWTAGTETARSVAAGVLCPDGVSQLVSRTTTTACVVWVYSGPLAGSVRAMTLSQFNCGSVGNPTPCCLCPTSTNQSGTWD